MASKPSITEHSSNSRLSSSQLNANLNSLASGVEGCLGRGGTSESPNSMTGNLDLDGNRILNVGNAVASGDAVSKGYLNTILTQDTSSGLVVVYEEWTATASQILFTFSSIEYTQGVNNLAVFIRETGASLQGYRRLGPDDFEETSTMSFTLVSGANNGDKVLALVNQPISTTDPTTIPAGATLLAARDTAVSSASSAASSASSAASSASTASDAKDAAVAAAATVPTFEDLTGDSGKYLRVDSNEEIEVRTTAQVLTDIGAEAADADILKADTTDSLEVGFTVGTEYDYGGGSPVSTGTVTVDFTKVAHAYYTNGGAHTLAPDDVSGAQIILVTNNASAGAITTSGWDSVLGDSLDTTDGNIFKLICERIGGKDVLTIQALQ